MPAINYTKYYKPLLIKTNNKKDGNWNKKASRTC